MTTTLLPIVVLITTLAALTATISAARLTATDVSALTTTMVVSAGNQHPLQPQQHQPHHHKLSTTTTTQCLYELVVKTALIPGAGTDARISLKLSAADENDARSVMDVGDLESWGWLGADHDYFEAGNMDIFGRRLPCLAALPCRMLLASDGSSSRPDWYPNMVEIIEIRTDLSVTVRKFFIDQWLAADKPPYQLFAYQDLCANVSTAAVAAAA